MKNSFRNRIYKKRFTLQFILLLIISLLMIFISRPFYQNEIVDFSFAFLSLAQRTAKESKNTVSSLHGTLASKKSLKEQNKALKIRVNELEKRLAVFSNLENRAYLFEKIFKETNQLSQYTAIGTTVIATNSSNLGNSFTLSAGSVAGVKKNNPVVMLKNGQSVLVGRVNSVSPWSSSVRPIYHISSSIGARLKKTRYNGLLRGLGDIQKEMIMQYVNKDALNDIEHGDIVITSGLSSLYPAGLELGSVSEISRDIEGPTITLTIHPLADFSRLEELYILTEIFSDKKKEIK